MADAAGARDSSSARRRARLGSLVVGCLAVSSLAIALALVSRAGADPPSATLLDTWETNGGVESIVRDGSSIYLGGSFTYVGPHTGGGAFVRVSDGALDPSFPSFDGGAVNAVVSDGSGGYFVGGSFTVVGGEAIAGLAHLFADGSIDAGWRPQPDRVVWSLARAGSVLYVGGEFNQIAGVARRGIAALSTATGTATGWSPGSASTVSAIAVIDDAVYLAAPSFAAADGVTTRSGVAAVDAASGQVLPFNPAGCCVKTLAASGHTLYLGGAFLQIGGNGGLVDAAAYDVTSGLQTGWAPTFDNTVEELVVDGSTVYAAGDFSQPARWLAAVDATTGAERAGWSYTGPPAVTVAASNGVLYVSSSDSSRTPLPPIASVVAVDGATGTVLADPWLSLESLAGSVAVVSGHVIAGGGFLEAGGVQRIGLAELDASSGQATSFQADARLAPFSDAGQVRALALSGTTLYVGGHFDTLGGAPRDSLAAIDTTNGTLLPWAPQLSCSTGDGPLHPSVRDIAPSVSGVYFTGQFSHVNGVERDGTSTNCSGIAAVDSAGRTLAFDAQPPSTGALRIAATPTTVYVGGNYTTIGGGARNNLAAFDAATGALTAWNPSPDGQVDAIAVSGSTVYVGGAFGRIGGRLQHELAAIDAGSGAATGWSPAVNANVENIAVGGNALFVAAGSGTVSGLPTDGLFAVDLRSNATAELPASGLRGTFSVASTPAGDWVGYGGGSLRGYLDQPRPARSGFASFGVTPGAAPQAGGGGGASGGGGGGAGGPLDLAVAVTSDSAQTSLGGQETFRIAVTDLTRTPANNLHVIVTLPAGAVVNLAQVDRGSGCAAGVTPGRLDCDLNYLSNDSPVGNIVLVVTLPNAGQAILTASATASQTDANPANNTASASVQVGDVPVATVQGAPPTRAVVPPVRHVISGNAKANTITGSARADQINAGAGNDKVYGGAGNDTIHGGPGNDLLFGGLGRDALFGDAGNDTIRAADGAKDTIDCGSGRDVAYVDKVDRVARSCEVVHRSR